MTKLILKAVSSPKSAASAAVDQVVGQVDTASGAQRLSISAQANTQYRLVDSKTGQVIKNQTVVRKGKTLQIEVDGKNVAELDNFFPEEASPAASGSEGVTYVVDTSATAQPSYGLVTAQSPASEIAGKSSVVWTTGMQALPLAEPVAFGGQALSALSGLGNLSGLGLVAGAAAVGYSNDGDSTAVAGGSTTASITGAVFKAEVANNTGLVVEAFDSTGKSRGKANVAADGTYSLTLDDPAFKGSLVLKMYDGLPNDGITPTFKDEATGEAQDFTKPLYAVVNYGGDGKTITVNVTPLTNLAATVAGVDTSTNKMTVPAGKTADQVVKEANAKVAQKFGLNEADLTAAEVHTTNSDKANDYGVALAIISKMEQSKTQDEVAAEFKKAVNGDSTSTFTASLQTAVNELKNSAGTNNDYLKNIDTSKLDKVSTVASDNDAPELVTTGTQANTSSDGTKVYLHFDSELSKNTADVNAFKVTVKTSDEVPPKTTTLEIESVAIDGKDVVLTLKTPITRNQTTIKVTYNDPTSGTDDLLAVQDLAGNDAASTGEIALKNNTTSIPFTIKVEVGQSFSYAENQVITGDTKPTIGKVAIDDSSNDSPTKFRFTDTQTSISKDGWYSIDKDGNISLTNVGLSAGKASNDFETKINGGNALVYGVQAGDDIGNWSASENITLNVTDDKTEAPSVKAPVSFTVLEDKEGNLVFAKDAFADTDSTNLTVTLNVKDEHGTLSYVTGAAGITVAENTDEANGPTYAFSGTTSALNAYFNTAGSLKYQDTTTDFNGTRTLNIKVSDSAMSTSITSNIRITAVNDAPIASSTTASLIAIDEDDTAATGSAVSVLFVSNFSDSKDAVTNGSSANTLAGVAITGNAATDAQGVWQWQAKGSETWTAISTSGLADATALYLAADSKLRFVPAKDYNGAPGALAARLVESSASSLTNGSTTDVSANGGATVFSAATVSLSASINAVNDKPVRTAGSDITLNIDEDSASTATSLGLGAYTYSAGGGSDEAAQALSYQFTNIPGSITLWNGETEVTTSTTGLTLADMQGLTYKTVDDANDSAAQNLTWTVTDNGTGTNSITETISVKVNAVNDAPVNTVPASAVDVEANTATFNLAGTQVAYTPKAITGLSIAVVDASTGTLSVTLSVGNGSLTHNTYNGVTFTKLSDSSFKASGSKDALNAWLGSEGGPTYTPTEGFEDDATLTMLTEDGGNSGSGGAQTDSDQVILKVADKTAPTLLKAETDEEDGSIIRLTYSEDLDGTNRAAKEAYVLSVKDGEDDVSVSVEQVSVEGRVVTLTLDKALELQQVVKLTYTDEDGDTTATVQDAQGNDSESFANQAVSIKVPDLVKPVVDDDQWFEYDENQDDDAVIAGVQADDKVGVTGYRFANNSGTDGTATSSDGYFSIAANGQITITDAGRSAGVNNHENTLDGEDDATTSFRYSIQARDAYGNWSEAKTFTLNLTNVNEAPTLTNIRTLSVNFTEDTYVEFSYDYLLEAAQDESDVDANDTLKFLVTEVTSGTLQKFESALSQWVEVTANSTTVAPGESLRWVADTDANGENLNAFKVKAQDADGLTSDTAIQVKAYVEAANDAPIVVSGKETVTLTAIAEDANVNSIRGATVSSLFSASFNDDKDAVTGGSSADTFIGIAITGNGAIASQGKWQWSADGTDWADIPNDVGEDAPPGENAFYLRADALVRFVPAADFNGTPGALTTHLVESSYPEFNLNEFSFRFDPEEGYFTEQAVTLTTSVTSVNDAPTVVSGKESVELTAIAEDANVNSITGATVSSLFSASFNDDKDAVNGGSSANTFKGIAITGNVATAAQGKWEYQLSGNVWTAVPTSGLSDSTALFIAASSKLRFVPAANFNGQTGGLQIHLVDDSASGLSNYLFPANFNFGQEGVSGSTATVTLNTTINAVNDPPTGSVTITNSNAGRGTTTLQQGDVLTASNTLADVDGLGTITYTWKAGSSTIGTGTTYTLAQADVGKAITVVASYTDVLGASESVPSSATSNVVNVNDPPTGSVTITNSNAGRGTTTLQQGDVLTASNTLADVDGLGTITYTWKAGSSTLGTGTTYTLAQADVGKAITVVASYTDVLAASESVPSSATSNVVNVDDAGTIGAITGTATQGQTLTAGSVTDPDGGVTGITYQWKAGGIDISGATSSTYVLKQAEVGKAITVVATYTDAQGSGKTVTSSATGNVVNVNDAPVATGLASLGTVAEDTISPPGVAVSSLFSGNFSDVDGNTLAGVAITANAADAAQGKWQWQANGTSTWTDIATSGLADATALYLVANTSMRFVPAANYNGAPGALTARLVDSSAIGLTNGTSTNVTTNGSTSAYSSATVSLGTGITSSNDAPTGTVTVSGSVSVGSLLTANNTLADIDGLDAISYKWEVLTGSTWSQASTATTYTPVAGDSGKSLRLTASYTDGGGRVESVLNTFTIAPAQAPMVKAVNIYSNALVLTFDELLAGSTGAPSAGAFTLNKYNSSDTATSIAITSVEHPINVQTNAPINDQFKLNYASQIMLQAATPYIKLSYSDPSANNDSNALQDSAGNDMPNFNVFVYNLNANSAAIGTIAVDYIMGGAGSDTITGGQGNDVLWGLDTFTSDTVNDNDTFVWLSGDAGVTGAVDIVKDFVAWNGTAGDKLNITNLLTGYSSGSSTLSQWVTSITTGQTVPGSATADSTKIVIDVDGSGIGTVTQTIWLEGVNLSTTDPATLKNNVVLIA